MQGLMAGKRGLIMGVANQRSIAWGIAQALHQHGAELAFTCQSQALERRVQPLAEQVGSDIVELCDVEDMEVDLSDPNWTIFKAIQKIIQVMSIE